LPVAAHSVAESCGRAAVAWPGAACLIVASVFTVALVNGGQHPSASSPAPGDGSDDPVPFCGQCGADIGVFLKFGLDWRHYVATTLDDIELFDPGHAPVVAWRIQAPAA
jgi:hypothetical protein